MKPHIPAVCKFKCKFIILYIVLSNIHMESISRYVMQRFCLYSLPIAFPVAISAIVPLYISAGHKLLLHLCQRVLIYGHIQKCLYRYQMIQLLLGLHRQSRQSIICPLKLVVLGEVSLGVIHNGYCLVQWDLHHPCNS